MLFCVVVAVVVLTLVLVVAVAGCCYCCCWELLSRAETHSSMDSYTKAQIVQCGGDCMVLYEQNPQFAPEAYHQACGHESFAAGDCQRFRRLQQKMSEGERNQAGRALMLPPSSTQCCMPGKRAGPRGCESSAESKAKGRCLVGETPPLRVDRYTVKHLHSVQGRRDSVCHFWFS